MAQGASDIERDRLAALLHAAGSYAIRFVSGPAGTGKTTLLKSYGAASNGRAIYAAVLPDAEFESIERLLDSARHADEVIFDDLDAATTTAIDGLIKRITADGDRRRFIFGGRSSKRMHAQELVSSGHATLLDASALAFNYEEIAALASLRGVSYSPQDVVQLLHSSDGWAVAVESIIQFAADANRSLDGAYDLWSERFGQTFIGRIVREHAHDADAFAGFLSLLRNGFGDAQLKLQRFDSLGFPVVRTRTAVRPYRILVHLTERGARMVDDATSATPLMTLKVFGRLQCQIGERAVNFMRRRDQNVLTFVALAPEGRATRKQIMEAFWPRTTQAIATQGLRTTLSRVRRAIAEVVGPEAVDLYFSSADDVRVDFKHVAVDAQRFMKHVRCGQMEEARGAMAAAKHHYTAAERLYRDRLLSSEALEPCFAANAEELEKVYGDTLVRLVKIHTGEAEFDQARDYGGKLLDRAGDETLRDGTLRLFASSVGAG